MLMSWRAALADSPAISLSWAKPLIALAFITRLLVCLSWCHATGAATGGCDQDRGRDVRIAGAQPQLRVQADAGPDDVSGPQGRGARQIGGSKIERCLQRHLLRLYRFATRNQCGSACGLGR